MLKCIQDGYNLLFWVFVIICLYGSGNSEQLKEDYTPVANNEIEELWVESNTEWGSISDPRY
tara:strand:- start:460 stop:645 length:186 start_codon:yes stop_codon:yes gene_type:complete